jgi:preprotein translocase subunit SecF
MLELIPSGLHLDFIGKAKFYIALSLLVILAGIGSILLRGGLNLGVDFRGGTLLQLRFSQPVELRSVRDVLGPLGLGQGIVQHFGNEREVLIRVSQLSKVGQDIATQVQQAYRARFPEQRVELRRTEVVGPQASVLCADKLCLPCFTPSWAFSSTSRGALKLNGLLRLPWGCCCLR